ncbi:MAG: hypothetical protein WKF58_15000 [Ilumatobacteraceae bacterium]
MRALTDTIERAVADAQQVIDDAQAAGATAATWATDTVAQLEADRRATARRRRRARGGAAGDARSDGAEGR